MPFDPSLLRRFVGVIDLQHGVAVRGVAGRREHYEPVQSFRPPGGQIRTIAGDPLSLLKCYLDSGVDSVYVADLDAIRFSQPQDALLDSLLRYHARRSQSTFLFDVGVNGFESRSRIERIHSRFSVHDHAQLVIAGETAAAPDRTLCQFADTPSQRLAVSFDFHDGRWMSGASDPAAWADACRQHPIDTVIGLDLAAVGGTSLGRTLDVCRFLTANVPQANRIIGGGIRSEADAQHLLDVGADRLMVASLFVSCQPLSDDV
jgi:uncharacterized protein related to proFAR isomerase